MVLITGLLTLPLAPVRGTAWIAERVYEQAEEDMNDEHAIRAGLMELEAAREAGDFTDEEIDAAENELLRRLMASRGFLQEDGDGAIE